jgi:hypothetical protein
MAVADRRAATATVPAARTHARMVAGGPEAPDGMRAAPDIGIN